ncbi:DUF4400 domain-containing protein [Flavobacterium sp.]|uniref:DUF4400 domain-containing protein n=1 Tax=Flavobacterium sp. TaxID=239 RepID=UPI00263085C3|nr:DUF4400 domain-containing protein [Flavobacterium sp.]
MKFWVIVFPIILAIFLPLPNNPYLTKIPAVEMLNYKLIFGEERSNAIEDRTDRMFYQFFIQSGAYKLPSKDNRESGEFNQAANLMGGWLHGYMTRFWALVYRAMFRFNFLFSWCLSGAFIFVLAAIYDGQQVRNARKFLLSTANPVIFHFLTHASLLFLGLIFSWCFLPIALSPLVLLVSTIAIALLAWKANASYLG